MADKSIRLALHCLLGVLLLPMGCIPYVRQTQYYAFSGEPTQEGHADATRPVIQFGFNRESARQTYPFVQVLGEKGDFALSISLQGEGAKPYRALILRHLQIVAHGNTLFATTDSAFVQEVLPSTEAALYSKSYSRYYKSAFVIALDDTLTKPYLQIEYDLITQAGQRQRQQLRQAMDIIRRREFTGY